jgi:hypothetical protein
VRRAAFGPVLSLAMNLLACNGGVSKPDASAADAARAERPEGPQRLPADNFNPKDFEMRALDLNKDGIPDAYQYSQLIEGVLVIFRKEVDVNFDGKVDLIRNFNRRGELVTERLDHDFDGRVDVVNHFEKDVVVKKEYDTNFDGNIDVWRYYNKGAISRKEADLSHNGQVDYWEYYEDGKIDRVGIDRTGDGEVDEWETSGAS